ncbi:trypsin-like peptidase domain-containing protein [Paenibacillus oenotherae]|uniref:Trypsin-like peptidase domain-containing protein n=1 Tax=Paenibacillus oenotherae TaxID=1435645 RepID=A0ABS7D4T4_9BACL|nr:trypsin-like peptidase domain-containing protein [Paenibacillus oenotherae]MBW7474949.1 trypsin-like peptidase domain-containing protein [Paenibacillus oenotherae]
MSNKWLRLIAGLAAGVLLLAGTSLAAGGAGTGGHSLEAKVINGEVYVKASSLTKALGGTGTYNGTTKSYTYTPASAVPDVIKKVSPSVVAIIGKPGDSSSDDRYALAHGTGVVWKADGWIVTNAHVVKGMKNLVVVTADGKQFEGKITHFDELSDLAMVKINASKLPTAVFAPDPLKLQMGETVIAIGTPVSFSLRNTATTGILSGMNRSISSAYKLLQTDAAINPGNSGGPLVNLKGEVIGINSLKFVSEGIESLGFSIPSDTVRYVVNHFFKYGKVNRASLGLELEESWAAIVGLPTTEPLKVKAVESESASKAGIAQDDLLYSVGGKGITSIVELNELLKGYLPGQQIEVMLQSDGDLIKRKLTLVQG